MTGRVRPTVLFAAIATAAATALVPTTAHADHGENPTIRQLLDKCNNGTDRCVFHPDGPPETFMGPTRRVGEEVYNCTDDPQRFSVGWSDTVGESNSVGVSLTTEAGFAEVFKVSLEVSYNHTWSSSHTKNQSTWVEVRPGEIGWVTRAAEMQRFSGRYEMNFPDRYYGHYYWYAPFTAEGPAPSGRDTIAQHTRPMTDQERSQRC
ncbi:hypothetical protein [Streptomyces carminius]|uniref:hypothetical protein n=1 Tax=Streptomyces carminius TaxID=2665496 RepID=UPI0018EBC9F2|nr:hypothetical protein [Streptomyces carminius]